MRSSGGTPEFSGPIRSMQRPELMQRSEVTAAELEHWCGGAKEKTRGEMIKTPVPIYKGVDTRHARESRRPKPTCGYMDASIFGMIIKIRIN